MTEALRRWLSFGLLLLLLICGTPFSRAEIANTTAAFGLSATFTCDEQATIAYDGRSLSAFDYDPVVVPTADRDATSTAAASRIIGKSAEFLAVEGTPRFLTSLYDAAPNHHSGNENQPLEGITARFGLNAEFLAAESTAQVLENQAVGNAARDTIAASRPGSLIEQNFRVTGGLRRVDVLDGTTGIESKVGRTSLTSQSDRNLLATSK